MNHTLRRVSVFLSIAALVAATVIPAGAGGRATDAPRPAQAAHDYVMVKLVDAPTASYMGGIQNIPRTKPLPGRKLDLRSRAARQYRDYLASKRQDYRRFLQGQAPRATVVREYSVAFNGFAMKLNGESRQTLASGPGVAVVADSFLVRPAMTVSTGLIDADEVWPAAGGREIAGMGIKVGIIDTGIVDINTHPAFACKGPIQHKVYASGVAGFGPTIVFDHGTHVAGTATGCVLSPPLPPLPVSGTWSGVAPGAQPYDYNVFPGFGAGFVAFGGSAFSHDIAAALEDTVIDGMDVDNMSLGGGVQGPHDLLAEAVNATVDAGVVVAVAAGNSGPGDSTVESPGSAAGALTAGASTNPHFVGQTVSVPGVGTFGGAVGDFATFSSLTKNYVWWGAHDSIPATNTANDGRACTLSGVTSGPISGKIAVIRRGVCTFSTKIRNAQLTGAVGAVIVNNVAGDPTAMGQDGTASQPTIPAVMIGKSAGGAVITAAPGSMTITATLIEFVTANADIIAGFSSRGPSPFTYLIKPDVTAPGVNVYSSVFDGEFAFFQGTSMATPHVAGSAALLLDLHPGWSPADVKSALVNTAKRPVLDHDLGTDPTDVLDRGGGRIDLDAAHSTPVLSDPASASFGFWNGNKEVSATVNLTLRSASGAVECGVSVSGPSIVTAPNAVSVPASGTATLTLTLSAGKASQTPSGDYSGDVTLTCASSTLKVPWWTRINREAKP